MKAFLILAFFTLAHAAYFDKSAKIVGGEDATEHQAPYMITLQVDREGVWVHTCGGSILTPNWILSVAHCIVSPPNGINETFRIIAGQHNQAVDTGREQRRMVVGWEIHENFAEGTRPIYYDIILLRVDSPLVFQTGIVEPIALPTFAVIPVGDVRLFGWGNTVVILRPDILQTVVKPVVMWADCQAIVSQNPDNAPLHYTHLCTGPLETNVTACQGDNGGPIVQDEGGILRVVGIASWISHFPCGGLNAVTVYMRISAFIDWIQARIN